MIKILNILTEILTKYSAKKIHLNSILIISNFFIAFVLAYMHIFEDPQLYVFVNKNTLILGIFLCLQTAIGLEIEKKRPNPMVIILAFIMIFFYELRLITLVLYSNSSVFAADEAPIAAINSILLIIILSNFLLYSSFFLFSKGQKALIFEYHSNTVNTPLLVGLFITSICLGNLKIGDSFFLFDIISFIFNNFLTPHTILLVYAVIIFTAKRVQHRLSYFCLYSCVFLLFIVQILSYSRGAILGYFELFFCLFLVINVDRKLKIVSVGKFFAFIALIGYLSILIFQINTFSRENTDQYDNSFDQKITNFVRTSQTLELDFSDGLNRVFTRIGYLDFSAELIHRQDDVGPLFSGANYFKSITDNLMSPGFDVYDFPFISNALKYYRSDIYDFSRIKEKKSTYHTDQFGIYGELYLLFGYWSILVSGVVGMLLTKLYFRRCNFFLESVVLSRTILLLVFSLLINSFGLDYVLFKFCVIFFGAFVIEMILKFRLS